MADGAAAGRRVAFLLTDGVEESEYVRPREAVERAGARAALVSLRDGEIQAMRHTDKGGRHRVDTTVAQADPADYDALVLPGGVLNPDLLRMDAGAVEFVRAFVRSGRPVAAICHGPWTLVEADAVRGRTVTSWPSLRTDLTNAGATWVDEEVRVDGNLITSRKPDDLPAFCAALLQELGSREPAHA
ncbi:protease [Pilimelia terevasa]|uniref:Protease n=1 Tax=Pilimelia terevasa TaxID=53372 RepID=A0A8J3FFG0_9ACTN|nr:type 1 glutamine amidotransferase domain-containing protein [Pilimelia terevasa]GGK20188.1 protease [Pilimelia terevasa]